MYIRHRKKLLVHLLQSINTLLELEIIVRKLSLFIRLAELFLDKLLSPRRKRRELGATELSAIHPKKKETVSCALIQIDPSTERDSDADKEGQNNKELT